MQWRLSSDVVRAGTIIMIVSIVALLVLPLASHASTTVGPSSPGTSAGAANGACNDNTAWSGTGSPGNTTSNDTSYVTINTPNNFDTTDVSDELQLSNFGFSIPTGSKILGVLVESIIFTSAGGADYNIVSLFTSPGGNVGEDKGTGAVPNSDPGSSYTSWGSSADTWSRTWSATEVSSSNFGVAFCYTATGLNTQVNNDHVRVSVTYDALPTLSIAQPDGTGDTVTQGDSYNVTYTLADTDSVVTAKFFYDTNNSGLDGTALTGACASAAEGTGATCSWDTTGISPGSYYIYGTTTDSVNNEVSAYSSGQITISGLSAPTVSTEAADTVTSISANINGNISDTGGSNATMRGFAWGTNSGLSGGDTATTSSSGSFTTGTFSTSLSGLNPGITYYFRAFASNNQGTSTGNILSFVTSPSPSRRLRFFANFRMKMRPGGRLKILPL